MTRETPRDVYLPNVPRFVYGTDGDLTLSLPTTPWEYAIAPTGGDIEADSGVRAAFVLRRDELITFTLRFFESEWPDVQAFIDSVQDGTPFLWFPDVLDESTVYSVQLEAPAVGVKYEALPDSNYPLVQLLTITVARGASADVDTSGAIVAPEIRYIQGEETEGQTVRTPVDTDGGSLPALRHGGGAGIMEGGVEWHESGGRDGGGYVTTIANTVVNTDPGMGGLDERLGQYQLVPLSEEDGGDVEALPRFGGVHRAFNLRGMTLVAPLNVLGIARDSGSGKGFPSVMATIMTDRTLRIRRPEWGTPEISDGVLRIYDVGEPSTEQVPADGWFSLDLARGPSTNSTRDASPIGNGFAQLNLCREDDPAGGVLVIDAKSVNTGSDPLCGWMWGSEVCRSNSQGITGLGMDDGITYLRNVHKQKRFVGETYIARWAVNGPGAVIDADDRESQIGWDSRESVVIDSENYLLGFESSHGDEARWKNVVGKPALPADTRLHYTDVTICPAFEDCYGISVSYGRVTPFGHVWAAGPFTDEDFEQLVPYHANQTQDNPDPPTGDPYDFEEEATLIRNTFVNAREMYTTGTDRGGIKTIEGIFPYARVGVRWTNAVIEGGNFFAEGAALLNLVSEHSFRLPEEPGLSDGYRHDGRLLTRIGTTMVRGPRLSFQSDRWRTLYGYYDGQFMAENPRTRKAFVPTDIGSDRLQIGLENDLSRINDRIEEFDLDVPDAAIWSMFDACEVGYEVAIHKRAIVQREHAPFPPIATLGNFESVSQPWFSSNLEIGKLVAYDLSTDWDNDIDHTTIDFGDGSPVEPLLPLPFGSITEDTPFAIHTYAAPGTYTVIVTTEDTTGLAGVQETDIVVPAPQPLALFSFATDEGDPSGLTLDFTDVSTTPVSPFGTNEIVSWLYNFGDSTTSTSQNPSHAFSGAGTYTVSLTVANDLGETDSIVFDIDVPIPSGDSECDEFSIVPPPLFVQGDDFKGTNYPYIAYPDKEAFETYYWGDVFTAYYDGWGRETAFDLDFDVTFNGSPTLVMYFGASFDTGTHSREVGAGWSSNATDDGYPDEQYYDSFPYGPRSMWARSRFRAEAGVMSDASTTEDQIFEGLLLLELSFDRAYITIASRADKVILDFEYRVSGPPSIQYTQDLLTQEDIGIGREDEQFGEVGIYFEWDEDAETIRLLVWAGLACAMSGVAPLYDSGPLTTTHDEVLSYMNRYNWLFFPANIPVKKLWHGSGSNWYDFTLADNPYGYGLP